MKDRIIEILELPTDATDDQVIAAVGQVKAAHDERVAADVRERKITAKINQSGNALSRSEAISVLERAHEI